MSTIIVNFLSPSLRIEAHVFVIVVVSEEEENQFKNEKGLVIQKIMSIEKANGTAA